MSRGYSIEARRLMLVLIVLALAVRLVIPAGWMPLFSAAGHPTITLCTASGMVEAWTDADGKIHKSSPAKPAKMSGECVFACLGQALGALALGLALIVAFPWKSATLFSMRLVAIGHGLAAPPPPARGPPNLM